MRYLWPSKDSLISLDAYAIVYGALGTRSAQFISIFTETRRPYSTKKSVLSQENSIPRQRLKAVNQRVGNVQNRKYGRQTSTPLDRRIYILGLGGVGKLVAHSLAGIPEPPPITLLLYKDRFSDIGARIDLTRNEIIESRTGFQVERLAHSSTVTEQERGEDGQITNLIVAIKSGKGSQAISGIRHRLTAASSILFLTNGMGFVDEVYQKNFQDETTRPHALVGSMSHGVINESWASVRHTGIGSLAISVPHQIDVGGGDISTSISHMPLSARYLLRTITRAPVLGAVGVPPIELLQMQLERLATRAIIDPLSVIFECVNGELYPNFYATRLMSLMVAEISVVIRSLPELKGVPNVDYRFSSEKLRKRAFSIIQGPSAANYSSMLNDFRSRKTTDIEYVNGFFVGRGEEVGIRCMVNYSVVQMVKAKASITQKREDGLSPVEDHDEW